MKFCLIGTGYAAAGHAQAINKIKGSNVIAVCGSSKEHTRRFANKQKIFSSYTNIMKMLKNEQPDAVLIASIPSQHYADIAMCAKYVKVIVVEKPVVTAVNDIRKLKMLIKSTKCSLSVVYQFRYSKFYSRLKSKIQNNLSNINYVSLQLSDYRGSKYYAEPHGWRSDLRKSGGGILLQHGIHWINILRSIFGPDFEILSVQKICENKSQTESTLNVNLLANNIKLDLMFTSSSPSRPVSLNIYGPKFMYTLNGAQFKEIIQTKLHTIMTYAFEKLPFEINLNSYARNGSYKQFLEEVIQKNSGKKRESLFLQESFDDINLIKQIYNFK